VSPAPRHPPPDPRTRQRRGATDNRGALTAKALYLMLLAMTKKEIIAEIFARCKEKGNFVFDNDFVKETLIKAGSSTNPYDMTKVDDISKLPQSVIDAGYTIIHLGEGRHKFLKCLDALYHAFETIDSEEIVAWPYRPSILNDFSISESSILSLVNNHRILHDFLYQDFSAAPKMYNSERKTRVVYD
jgi:hypothetical protein